MRLPHIHRYNRPVLPGGNDAGVAMLAHMAATGRVPYACRCGRQAFR